LHEEISKYFEEANNKVYDAKDDDFRKVDHDEIAKPGKKTSKLQKEDAWKEEEYLNGAYRHPFEYVTPRLYIKEGSEL
jgi:hypothetical protein